LVSGEIIFGYWIDCLVIGKNKKPQSHGEYGVTQSLRDPLRYLDASVVKLSTFFRT